MNFNTWLESHKDSMEKVAVQTNTPYSDIVARMSYVWENGEMETGKTFAEQCPLFGIMDKKTRLFKLGSSAYYYASHQKN